jgi:uncharacterized protein (TIGR00251 family)
MIVQVKAKPNSKKPGVQVQADGTWLVHVNAPAVDGKANARLIEIVAEHCGVRKSAVSIRSGASARIKLLEIDHPAAD